MKGALDASKDFSSSELEENAAYQYAVVRNVLYNKGRTIEMLINYEPALQYISISMVLPLLYRTLRTTAYW